ncbi:hypothetical protein ACNKHR_15305 [Shigella flexneri]
MNLYIQIIVVACLTGYDIASGTRSAAVFHDEHPPILSRDST